MATLRRRRKDDEPANQEIGEEVQASLDFDSVSEPVSESTESKTGEETG